MYGWGSGAQQCRADTTCGALSEAGNDPKREDASLNCMRPNASLQALIIHVEMFLGQWGASKWVICNFQADRWVPCSTNVIDFSAAITADIWHVRVERTSTVANTHYSL